MHKWIKLGLTAVLMFLLALTGCATGTDQGQGGEAPAEQPAEQQPADEKKDVTITFGVTPWTSTVPPTQIARLLLEDMGYTVKLQDADAGVVYTGLSKGDIDVFMDSWLPDMHRNYMEKYGENIEDTAVSYPNGELGWVIPTYVEGINSVEDLKGKEDLFGGKIYGIEEGAGMTITSREMIKTYGLNLQYVPSSESGMLAQAKREIGQNNPVLFLGWRPHPMFVNWDLKVLPDPKKFFKTSEVHVLTNKGFKEKAPEAHAFLKKWSIPVEDIEAMIVQINDGKDPREVARAWIDNNQDKVNEMLGK
ncbi:glycine betaine ABC transporter substrate-binding protein [Brevibacillus humidisoli]|uniref:glycine betaine ABC transporter substrate-binding protein n=1 Tax=Brevibacillus humidisoli TaxID=2895522 RepID=UPI001E29F6A7|nr:glycine betaine ABC transporter substrate-binding protein [Brevibacillus humidisoli]UFJ40312.1 glycine betaine ABC transporter substrate-binding protein [Brevibacillus humidisoli]